VRPLLVSANSLILLSLTLLTSKMRMNILHVSFLPPLPHLGPFVPTPCVLVCALYVRQKATLCLSQMSMLGNYVLFVQHSGHVSCKLRATNLCLTADNWLYPLWLSHYLSYPVSTVWSVAHLSAIVSWKMRLRSGAEERGCGYRVKKARIYVQLQLQGISCSRRVLRTRPYILRIQA
jgi:hypothetical protein